MEDGAKNNGTSSGEPSVHFKSGDPEQVRMGSMSSSPSRNIEPGCMNLPILFERAGSCFPTPKFDSEILESEQWKSYFPQTHRRFQYALIYVLVACVLWAIYFGVFNEVEDQWPSFLVGTIVLFLVITSILGFTYTRHYEKLYLVTSVIVSMLLCIGVLLTLIYKKSDLSTIGAFTASVEILLMIYSVIPLPLVVTIIIGVVYSVLFEAFNLMQNQYMQEPVFIAGKILLHLCIHIMGVHIFTMRQVRQRSTFLKIGQSVIVRQDLEFEKQIKEKMIHSLMPPSVAAQVLKTRADKDEEENIQMKKRNSKTKALGKGEIIFRTFNMNRMEDVSILFADIVGFTKMSSNKTAERLVGLLNDLFARFDILCTETGCEKISTLGDCYYAVAGCPIPKPDHARCCVEMGLGMIEAIKQFDIDNNEEVNMRVGVHTGTVLCGIVGTRRFKFDVWSNDVFLANTMESSGEPGRVHISETTLVFLNDEYEVELGPDCEDNRSERKLVEEYDKDTSQYAVKHATWDKMIKTYFIIGPKKDGVKSDTNTPTVAEVQPDTVAISMEAENGPTESDNLMNDAQQDANGIMSTLSSHLNNSLNNLDQKDLERHSAQTPSVQTPCPIESNGKDSDSSNIPSPLVSSPLDSTQSASLNNLNVLDGTIKHNENFIPVTDGGNVTHLDETSLGIENIDPINETQNEIGKIESPHKSNTAIKVEACGQMADNQNSIPQIDECNYENGIQKTDELLKRNVINQNGQMNEAHEIKKAYSVKEPMLDKVSYDIKKTHSLKESMLNNMGQSDKVDRPFEKKGSVKLEVHIPNPNGEVISQSPTSKSNPIQTVSKDGRFELRSDVGSVEGSPVFNVKKSFSHPRPLPSPVLSKHGTPTISRDGSYNSSTFSSPRFSRRILHSDQSVDRSPKFHQEQFENFFNPSPKSSPGGKKRINVDLPAPIPPSEPQTSPRIERLMSQEAGHTSILSAVYTVGLSLLRLGDLSTISGLTPVVSASEVYDISMEPMNKTFSKIRKINHHTDVNKTMDMHIVKCIQEGIKDKEYLYKPPINQFTLAFTDKNLEDNYRDHYLGEEHNQRTISAPKYLSFLEIIVSFVVFIVVSIFCFVVFDRQMPAIIIFCVSLLLEILNIIRGYMTIKHSETKEQGFWSKMINVTSGWYLRNFIGALIASLPLIAVFGNFSCHLMRSTEWTDRFFCFCIVISLVHYTNFTTLSSWMKSIIVFLAGVVLIVLITVVKCTSYVDMSTISPVSVTQVVIGNSSFPNMTDSTNDTASTEYIPLFSGLHIVQSYTFFEIILDMVLLVFLIGFLNRESEISYRLNYHGDAQAWEYKQIMQENKDQADWLLNNIIPPHVSEIVRDTSKYSKNHTDVGVIFAAIVNFNEIYDESFEGGREFLRVLNELVSDYEDLLDEQRFKDVEKIKTISSTFMAASGLNETSRGQNSNPHSHLYSLVEFSTELQNCIQRFNDGLFNFDFIMNIGFNFGEVTAGVIGTTKLLYDIWGDTVNISSRMYSTGVAERIQVPESCAIALGDKMEFEYRGEITVKGKGIMKTFLYTKTKDGQAWPWQ